MRMFCLLIISTSSLYFYFYFIKKSIDDVWNNTESPFTIVYIIFCHLIAIPAITLLYFEILNFCTIYFNCETIVPKLYLY